MSKWIKPSGAEFETNDLDATIAYLTSLKWKRVDSGPAPEPEAQPEPEQEPAPAPPVKKGPVKK